MTIIKFAWRGARRGARRSILTILASGGALFVLAFVAALADGYLEQRLRGGLSMHLGQGILRIGSAPAADSARLAQLLTTDPEVAAAAPRQRLTAFMKGPAASAGAVVLGVDAAAEVSATDMPRTVVEGAFLTETDMNDPGSIVLGAALAAKLGARMGDRVAALAEGSDGMLAAEPFRVVGIFKSGSAGADGAFAYIDRRRATALAARANDASEIVLKLRDPWSAEATVARLAARPQCAGFEGVAWTTTAPELASAVSYFRAAEIVRGIVVLLLAGLTLFNTLILSIVERRREFGVLLAIGMLPRQIMAVLALESAMLVGTGAALGAAAAVFVTRGWLSQTGIDITKVGGGLTGALEGATRLHPLLDAGTIARAAGYVLLLFIFVLPVPIWRVLRLEAAEAIREN
ncbi:MAG: ABC transporter permease [Planctomycetes bacterium]|nr:ABC transporter permease [Planctomycetota bacterium]